MPNSGTLSSQPNKVLFIIAYFDKKFFLWYKLLIWEFKRNEINKLISTPEKQIHKIYYGLSDMMIHCKIFK